jgi:hypothetical protein
MKIDEHHHKESRNHKVKAGGISDESFIEISNQADRLIK